MRVSTVTVGVFKGREPWGVHSQESDSLRRQHLPRVTMAGQQQTPPKMPTHEEANTRPQHQSRLPSLQTLHQVRDGAGGAGGGGGGGTGPHGSFSVLRLGFPALGGCCGKAATSIT